MQQAQCTRVYKRTRNPGGWGTLSSGLLKHLLDECTSSSPLTFREPPLRHISTTIPAAQDHPSFMYPIRSYHRPRGHTSEDNTYDTPMPYNRDLSCDYNAADLYYNDLTYFPHSYNYPRRKPPTNLQTFEFGLEDAFATSYHVNPRQDIAAVQSTSWDTLPLVAERAADSGVSINLMSVSKGFLKMSQRPGIHSVPSCSPKTAADGELD